MSTIGTSRLGIRQWGGGEDLGAGIELVRSPLVAPLVPMVDAPTTSVLSVNPVKQGSELDVRFASTKRYDPADLCTARYTVGIDEHEDRVDLWILQHGQASRNPCDLIGYSQDVRVRLAAPPLGDRVVRTWSRLDGGGQGYKVVAKFESGDD